MGGTRGAAGSEGVGEGHNSVRIEGGAAAGGSAITEHGSVRVEGGAAVDVDGGSTWGGGLGSLRADSRKDLNWSKESLKTRRMLESSGTTTSRVLADAVWQDPTSVLICLRPRRMSSSAGRTWLGPTLTVRSPSSREVRISSIEFKASEILQVTECNLVSAAVESVLRRAVASSNLSSFS